MRDMPRYFYRGSGKGPKAGPDERKLQILRILHKNEPKWTSPRAVVKELGINITNAQNLLVYYESKDKIVKTTKAELGKYELAVYRLIDHGRYVLRELERQFAGKLL